MFQIELRYHGDLVATQCLPNLESVFAAVEGMQDLSLVALPHTSSQDSILLFNNHRTGHGLLVKLVGHEELREAS